MAKVSVRYKAMALLLNRCFKIVAPIVRFCVYCMFCFSLLCVLSRFDGEDKAGCFSLFVFLVSCDCYCSLALTHVSVS